MLALVMLNILCVYLCYIIARDRGGDARFWGWVGLLFGPFAVPLAFFAKPKIK
jgi:hypothetical protein